MNTMSFHLRNVARGVVAFVLATAVPVASAQTPAAGRETSAASVASYALTGQMPVDPEVLTLLAGACRDHHGLRFDYEDRRGSASQRRIEPQRVVHAEGRWYLVAWDTDRQDWRTFRVDRIRSHIVAGPRTAARELSDDEITALISGGVPPAARRSRTRVMVLASAEAIADRVGPWVGTVEPIDAFSCVLETGADDLDILAVHLGMLNVDFIVTEPPELVTHMLALGARYTRAVRV